MTPERLASMPQFALAYDRETELIQPGLLAPPPVLGSAAELGPDGKIRGVILANEQCLALFQQVLADPKVVICGANIAFDFLVEAYEFARRGVDIMPGLFAMYDPGRTIVRGHCDGRVFEIQLAEPLHAIANGHLGKHALTLQPLINKATGRPGRYSLDTVTYEVTGREDAKANDIYRMSYAQFKGVPIADLPFQAKQYPIDDACNTLEDALAQAGHLPSVNVHQWEPSLGDPNTLVCSPCGGVMTADAPQACMVKRPHRNLHNLANQAYFAWAAHLGAAWGFHVPQGDVDALEAKYTAMRASAAAPFKAAGILRDNDTEDQGVLKRLVAVAYGARDICTMCNGTRKVPSEATAGRTKINCDACDGTGLALPPEVPRSDGGGIKKARDALLESGDELLVEYGEQPSKKILTTYIPLLRKGRACVVCGRTGCATKYTKAHEDWCTAPNGEAGYREIPLIVRVDPLKETGRSAVEDGLHGLPRKGGVRECIQSRPGWILSSEDYLAGELVALAWVCLKLVGYSRLADALNHKIDAHLALAGTMLGKSYDDMLKLKKAKVASVDGNRQAAKKANFGYGGGMAELTFVLRNRADPDLFTPCPNGPSEHDGVRGYNGLRPCILMDGRDRCGDVKIMSYNDNPCPPVCKACVEAAKRLRGFWFQQWPEMNQRDGYFSVIKKLIANDGPSGTPEIQHLITGRIRGGVGFCDGSNGLFQGLLADVSKAAFCQIQRECCDRTIRVESSEHMLSRFAGGGSPLLGSRAIMNAHDEAICEHPESVAPEAATRASEIMVETFRFACPELAPAIQAPPALMRKLYKSAEPRYARGGAEPADENDRLVCWEP